MGMMVGDEEQEHEHGESPERKRLEYNGYHNPGAFATLDVFRHKDGRVFLVVTDESAEHKNTSLTNRVERVMYLAWAAAGFPAQPFFIEHYRPRPGEPCGTYDLVTFPGLGTRPSRFQVDRGAPEFGCPTWKHLAPGQIIHELTECEGISS